MTTSEIDVKTKTPSGESGEPWTRDEAEGVCYCIEKISPSFGFHVALTGGLLYKSGPRKDCDLVFYPAFGARLDREGLFEALKRDGIEVNAVPNVCGWVWGARFGPKRLDLFFPHLWAGASRVEF